MLRAENVCGALHINCTSGAVDVDPVVANSSKEDAKHIFAEKANVSRDAVAVDENKSVLGLDKIEVQQADQRIIQHSTAVTNLEVDDVKALDAGKENVSSGTDESKNQSQKLPSTFAVK